MQSELKALAERVQALTGPCRETDEAVALSVGWRQVQYGPEQRDIWKSPCGALSSLVPAFTASLDAAITLVPERHFARIYGEAAQATIVAWNTLGWEEVSRSNLCATPALALTAAALLALAEQVPQ